VASRVNVERRGDICVVRCGAWDAADVAASLEAELKTCREAGGRDVVVDLEDSAAVDDRTIAALRAAARACRDQGGEFVVACGDKATRERLANAGLAGGCPEAPAGPAFDGAESVALPDRPRWQHVFSFPAADHEIPNARRRVVGFAEICGMRGASLFELHVAVGEALANALLHGSPHGADDDITVRFFCYSDEVAVEVGDHGEGMAAAPICAPDPSQPAGRGIHFMRTLADDMLFACGPSGTRVLLVKRLR